MGRKSKDLTGQIFGELKAIKVVDKNKSGNIWECECSCGKIVNVLATRLLTGKTKSCGHLKNQERIFRDLIGFKFERLTVIGKSKKKKYWICKCDCGNIKEIYEFSLINNKTKSCGCLHKEKIHEVLYEDLTNNRYGRWTVTGNSSLGANYCKCQCDCGTIKDVCKSSLKNGNSTSCGCYKKEITSKNLSLNLEGQKFGKLFVIKRSGTFVASNENKYSTWLCQCECGNTKIVKGHDLVRGSVSSCGCLISKGEYLIRQYLLKNNICFDTQYSFKDLKSDKNYPLKFDFAILNDKNELKCLIEFQGEQHDKNYEKYHINFGEQQRNVTDNQKEEYCKLNNIKLFKIWYYQNIEQQLDIIMQQLYVNSVPSL